LPEIKTQFGIEDVGGKSLIVLKVLAFGVHARGDKEESKF
jgi:hypothetical protein